MQGAGRRAMVWVLGLLAVATAGCNTPEEKALAQERVDLVKIEAGIVERTPGGCTPLKAALGDFEKTSSARIAAFNTKWKALPEKKRNSLMKPHRKAANADFKALIEPIIRCGAIFPVD